MTVFRPSLPPYRVTSTSVRAPGSRRPAVARISRRPYALPPAARAAPATTPLAVRNRRRVSVSMSYASSVDGVFGGGQTEREQSPRLAGRGGERGRGPVGPAVDDQQGGQRVEAIGPAGAGERLDRGRSQRGQRRPGPDPALGRRGGQPRRAGRPAAH